MDYKGLFLLLSETVFTINVGNGKFNRGKFRVKAIF